MAATVQLALGFRTYRSDKQSVLLELILVNAGNDEAINVDFDIWPDEGESQSFRATSIPGCSVFRPGKPLDLGREMPVRVSAWVYWENREGGASLQGGVGLAVDVTEGKIKVSPGGSPLTGFVEAHGIPLGSLSTDFSVVPLEEAGDEQSESGSLEKARGPVR